MDKLMVVVERATFAYGSHVVVDGLNLVVRSGEVLGIAGPNGVGKSTLIKALSGVVSPKSGRVLFRRPGATATDLARLKRSEVARLVAVVPQDTHLPESFTAMEIVQMGRIPHLGFLQTETVHDWTSIWRAMTLTDTLQLADRRVGELSGGERQRVVIARALAQEPRMLLLDEPTAHLDLAHQIAVLDLVQKLHQQCELTVVAVFHDLNLAAQYCQRLIMLSAGGVVADGAPTEVITAENLRLVYGVHVHVLPNPFNHLPMTVAMSSTPKYVGANQQVTK